jgi:hypothetical protein
MQKDEKKPIDGIREKLAKGQEKLSQDETSTLVDQYMIDSFEAPSRDRTYAASDEGIRIERFTEDDAECHSCGEIGRPRYLIHLGHLCQHFVALCDVCWKRFRVMVAQMAD